MKNDLLQRGTVIPAHPLALTAERKLDERRQRALSRYYLAAGAGGLAVGVHTTQFRIHDPKCGLLRPVLTLAAEEMNRAEKLRAEPLVRVAGICGKTAQAVCEARLARELGYQLGLVNLGAFPGAPIAELLDHCRAIAEEIGLFGFYLQPAVGGVLLPIEFWRGFCEIDNARAIKVAAFNRYLTLHVMRAVAESGRDDIALYTGNDDNIVLDLVTPFSFQVGNQFVARRFVGGLLGQWAVWTSRAVGLLAECHRQVAAGGSASPEMLTTAVQLTDANAAIFDAANDFSGCVPGIHEVLRRQGLLAGNWCLDEDETLGPGQAAEIDRVLAAYGHLRDDDWVAKNLDDWLNG
ncbi:MAG: dihydrodipicolinate synthase family protein [Planctomycetales bacterium]|nr:dihydrodipicolinate synthase family protein [Planctomycetales bacterium]